MLESKWKSKHTIALISLISIIVCIPYEFRNLFLAWILVLILLAISFLVIGHGVTGLYRGLLIDERNMISLSRLQMVIWTIIVISALITATISNAVIGAKPLSIKIPEELWILMGISVTSLIGSPLIKSTKYTKNLNTNSLKNLRAKGCIVVNDSPNKATLSDIFSGEEVANATSIDLSKVQMFYFTVILSVVYAIALSKMFMNNALITEFPEIDSSIIWLLGISHGGYLVHKMIPKG